MEERKHIIEIIKEIDRDNYIDEETSSDIITAIMYNMAGDYHGKYHFWIEQNGFCQGDATDSEIQKDIEEFGVSSLDEVLENLNEQFLEEYKERAAKAGGDGLDFIENFYRVVSDNDVYEAYSFDREYEGFEISIEKYAEVEPQIKEFRSEEELIQAMIDVAPLSSWEEIEKED